MNPDHTVPKSITVEQSMYAIRERLRRGVACVADFAALRTGSKMTLKRAIDQLSKLGEIRKLEEHEYERFDIRKVDGRKYYYILSEDASAYAIFVNVVELIPKILAASREKNDSKLGITAKQIEIYMREITTGTSNDYLYKVNEECLFNLYRIAEDGQELIRDENVRISLLIRCLESMVTRTTNSTFEKIEIEKYLSEKLMLHFSELKSSERGNINPTDQIIANILIILGHLKYPDLRAIVLSMLGIKSFEESSREGNIRIQQILEISQQIHPKNLLEIFRLATVQDGSRKAVFLNQIIKGNIDLIFNKEVETVDSNQELSDSLRQLRVFAKNM